MSTFVVLVRVLLGTSVSRGRLLGLASLGLVAIAVGTAIGMSSPTSPTTAGAELVSAYGLSILVPVVTLVLATGALGSCVEDNTLVYLWLRPVSRITLATAAITATVAVAAPMVVVPLTVAALLTGGGGSLVVATIVSSTMAVVGYAGLFVASGLLAKRALLWGVFYILIWEGFIARAGTSSSRFSVQYYARTVLSELSDVPLRLSDAPIAAAFVVPIVVAAVGGAVTALRLQRMSVA